MKTASISTTKNQLSALIEQVRHGETILITDHDRPVARLIPVVSENGQSDELALLERKGIRVATKYVNAARDHFASKGVHIDLIKLYGSMEFAPLVGLSDVIVDLVSTGGTLKSVG